MLVDIDNLIIVWHIKSCNVTINYTDIKTFNVVSIRRGINYVLQYHRLRTSNIECEVEQSDEFRRLQKKGAVTCNVMYSSAVAWIKLGRYKKNYSFLGDIQHVEQEWNLGLDPLRFVCLINIYWGK